MDLSDYLDRRYVVDRAMVKEVAQQTDSALGTLVETNLGRRGWPYSLTNGDSLRPDRFSESTAAMILHAVAVAYGVITDSVLVPNVQPGTIRTAKGDKRNPAEVMSLLRNGTSALIAALKANSAKSGGRELTCSNTWGVNSALTLTWVYELLKAGILADAAQYQPILRKIRRLALQRLDPLANDPASVLLKLKSDDDYPVHHPFVLLRTLQLVKAVGPVRWSDLQVGSLSSAFLNQLHTELSNSAIQNSGFDPACLVFALEGLLTINPEAISDSILQKVVDILSTPPSLARHLQPVHPLVATNRGFTLLPQSVEVANSYLRICGLERDRRLAEEPLFTRSFAILQSYTEWLLSQAFSLRIEVRSEQKNFQGWQSEHTYRPNIVHSWATSQVVLFLQYYSAMLQEHIAHLSRIAVSLDFRPQSTSLEESAAKWTSSKKQEPLLGSSPKSALRAYNHVDRLFVTPRVNAASSTPPPKYSILLYGPPGTGKTSFAEALAEALHYDLIIVSPSDFIRGGEAGVEERAKRIFDVLLEQSNCVILFDEIDRLILDRDSSEYASQGDMFQFMTPSMLTKINDLRKRERSAFIIATNYAERIDSAIKRPGRIDEQIVLLPPDMKQRIRIIEQRAGKAALPLTSAHVEEIAKKTPLYIYKELEYIVQSIAKKVDEGLSLEAALAEVLEKRQSPTITLKSYRSRFYRQQDSRKEAGADPSARKDDDGDGWIPKEPSSGPWKEFALLSYLQAEANPGDIPGWAKSVLNQPKLLEELDSKVSSRLKTYIARNR